MPVVTTVARRGGSSSPPQQQQQVQRRPARSTVPPPTATVSLSASAAPADAAPADAAPVDAAPVDAAPVDAAPADAAPADAATTTAAAAAAAATATAAAGVATTARDGGPVPGAGAGLKARLTTPLTAALPAPGEDSSGATLSSVDVTALRTSLARRRFIRRWGMATSAVTAIVAYIISPLPPPPAGVPAVVAAVAAGWVVLGGTAEVGHDGCLYLHSPFAAGRRALGGSAVADRPVPFPPTGSVTVRPTGDGRGWGVYAATALPAGTPLGEYEGEILDTAEFFARYPPDGEARGDYVLALDAEWVVDGAAAAAAARATATYTPALMNHARLGAAVARVARRRARAVGFVTTRSVEAGEELCWDYGRTYWSGREDEEML
ncbi:hypothetical protein MMPV_001790 [Pyropia vietnamensis]